MAKVQTRKPPKSRAAERTKTSNPSRASGHEPPVPHQPVPSARDSFMLARPAPPAFPGDLIVPRHRGAVITAAAWPTALVPPANDPRKASDLKASDLQAVRAAYRTASALPAVAPVKTPAPKPAEPAAPAAASVAKAPETRPDLGPIPRERALAPRRQGFIDTIAFVLLDSGRRLARWSSARRKAEETRAKLARAEARLRAMEAQLAALQALQERVPRS